MSNYIPTNGIRVRVHTTYVYDPDMIDEYTALAKDWATKTDGMVQEEETPEDYSAKAWAIGGTGTETNNAKYWAGKAQEVYDNMGDVSAILDYINGEEI